MFMRVKLLKKIILALPAYSKEVIFLLLFYLPARLVYSKRNIWLISERGDDARDNSMHLFRYIREYHPAINLYYVIDRKSADLNNIIDFGNVVYRKTFKHRLFFYASKVLISTHLMGGYTTNQSFYMHFNKMKWFRFNRKVVSIKHGITKDDLPILYKENSKLDLLISGAKPEYEYFLKNYHYSEKEVKYTGFARFDNLFGKNCSTKNIILVMPTWRFYLSDLNDEDFQKTTFYNKWVSFLNNNDLCSFLENNNLFLYFYPHYELQKYLRLFYSKSKMIRFCSKEEYDVQQLLIDSKILITDYSSVFFDFAYMEKPVVFYQFDEDIYFKKHYKKGYFDYNKSFGLKTDDELAVVNEIVNLSKSYYKVPHKYVSIIDSYFEKRDNHNCERITNEIIKITEVL